MSSIRRSEIMIENQKLSYISSLSKHTIKNTKKENSSLLVFLHGWGSSASAFSALFPDTTHFIALDFPGSGHSSPLKKIFTLEEYTRITHLFLQKIQVQYSDISSFSLVGHSFGGRVIAKLIHLYPEFYSPEKIQKILFIAVPFYREKTCKTELIKNGVGIFHRLTPFLPQFLVSKIKSLGHKICGENDYFDLAENTILKKTFQNIVAEEIASYLSEMSLYHTFCFWGEKDDVIPLSFAYDAKEKSLPAMNIIPIIKAGHFPWIDNPDSFMKGWDQVLAGRYQEIKEG